MLRVITISQQNSKSISWGGKEDGYKKINDKARWKIN